MAFWWNGHLDFEVKLHSSCRSTSSRLVHSRSLSQKTYQARRQKTKNSRLKTSYTFIILLSSFVHKRYVVVTYQPHAHICISCKRYVVVTNRSIIFTLSNKNVSYTYNSDVLTQIGAEQLRDKRIFIYFPYCIFLSLIGAIFKTNSAIYYLKPTFFNWLCGNLSRLTVSTSLQ